MEKICLICNSKFNSKWTFQIYCCENCKKESIKINSKKWYNKNKKELSIYYKNKYIPKEKKLIKCLICNNEFQTNQYNKIYCSRSCLNKSEKAKKRFKKRDKSEIRILYLKNYNNSEKAKENRKKYYTSYLGKKTQSKYKNKYYHINILFNLRHKIRIRIHQLLKKNNYLKDKSSIDYLGCSIIELKQHLENQFTLGMSWKNYGWGWHIDHIIPLSSAKNKSDLYNLFHYKNLQPLWAKDNLIKSNKLVK